MPSKFNSIRPDQKTVIGRGIKFPVEFANIRKDQLLLTSEGHDVIHQSLRLILSTRKGERVNNNEFGTELHKLVFEPNDILLRDQIYFEVSIAIRRWERRISLLKIAFQNPDIAEGHHLNVIIYYVINSTHQQGSYVYPFVLNPMSMSNVIIGKARANFAYPGRG